MIACRWGGPPGGMDLARSVSPIAVVGAALSSSQLVEICKLLNDVAHEVNVDFIGGFSALVQKGIARGDRALIEATIESETDSEYVCKHGAIEFNVSKSSSHLKGDRVTLAIRPEKFNLADAGEGLFQGKVTESTYMGTDTYLKIKIDDTTELEVRCQNEHLEQALPAEGDSVGLNVAPGAATLLED